MLVTVAGIVTLVTAVLSLNTLLPIAVTVYPSMVDGMSALALFPRTPVTVQLMPSSFTVYLKFVLFLASNTNPLPVHSDCTGLEDHAFITRVLLHPSNAFDAMSGEDDDDLKSVSLFSKSAVASAVQFANAFELI